MRESVRHHVNRSMRVVRFVSLLLLTACAVNSSAARGPLARPRSGTCGLSAVAFAWVDGDRNGLRGPDEEPLPGVHILLTQVDTRGPFIGDPARSGVTDARGHTFFRIYFAGCPPTDFRLRASPPRGYSATTVIEVPVTSGDTVRFGFVRGGA
jgi:hypothetical protein